MLRPPTVLHPLSSACLSRRVRSGLYTISITVRSLLRRPGSTGVLEVFGYIPTGVAFTKSCERSIASLSVSLSNPPERQRAPVLLDTSLQRAIALGIVRLQIFRAQPSSARPKAMALADPPAPMIVTSRPLRLPCTASLSDRTAADASVLYPTISSPRDMTLTAPSFSAIPSTLSTAPTTSSLKGTVTLRPLIPRYLAALTASWGDPLMWKHT